MSDRIEPELDPTAEPAPPPRAAPKSALDQLSRIEEKAARIEEKFARYEAVLNRAEHKLDHAAQRVESAARSVDAAELAREVGILRILVERAPGRGALFMAALITAVATTALLILILKFVPGLIK
jgi:hypothetical protein